MNHLRQDLAYTLRRLSRSPGFVFAVVLSIGLGIAANATIFSIVSRFVLHPAPVGDPSTLLNLHTLHDGDSCCNNFSEPVFRDVRDQARSFNGVTAYYPFVPASIGGLGESERVVGQATSANFFQVLQIPMSIGRGFLTSEENQQSIVLGSRLWKRRFNSDPSVVGRAVTLSGRPYTVVGVAPAGFHGVESILDSEFWVPFGNLATLAPDLQHRESRDMHWLSVLARLKPGVSRAQAKSELDALASRLATAYPATDKGTGFLFDAAGSLPARMRSTIYIFLTALSVVVLLVLCIACANVTNLMLAQTLGRQREMAVRLALGATRARLLRQILLESLLLSCAGGALGVLLSIFATRGLSMVKLPAPVPLDLTVSVNSDVLAFSFALSVAAGLLFGFAPAWLASHPRLANALKGEDTLVRPGRRIPLRNVLIVVQISMCVVLLSSTGLFLRSLQQAANIEVGFRSSGIISMQVDPRVNGYTPQRIVQFLADARERVAAIPGASSAAVTDMVPLSGGGRSDGMHPMVRPKSKPGVADQPDPIVEMYMVTPGYFETMGIPRLAGRDFAQNAGASGLRPAVVNQALVQRMFGAENPIGQSVVDGDTIYQIIGVVGNIKARTLGEEIRPVLFRSLDQTVASEPSPMGYTLLIRSTQDPSAVIAEARNEIRNLDSGVAVYNVQTMQEHLRDAFVLPRLAATLFGVFGTIGLILASVGLYGAMSYSVKRRTREIGIRMALGARVAQVQRLIVRQGMVLAVIAVVCGMPAAIALARLFSSVLYGVSASDPLTFLSVPIFLAVIALFACWLPARRASRVDPQIVLRCE
jgi:predicted permease